MTDYRDVPLEELWTMPEEDFRAVIGNDEYNALLRQVRRETVLSWFDILKHADHNQEDHGNRHGADPVSTAVNRGLLARATGGGLTISTRTGSTPTRGYVVATKGNGRTFGTRKPSARELGEFIADKMPLLASGRHHLGMWDDRKTPGGKFWLDVVEVHDDEAAARQATRERGEIAYFDLEAGEERRV